MSKSIASLALVLFLLPMVMSADAAVLKSLRGIGETGNAAAILQPPAGNRDGEACNCGDTQFNHDGGFENGYAGSGDEVSPPYFGAFAECFHAGDFVCGLTFYFSQTGNFSGQTMDVYIWADDGGKPGEVIAVIPDVTLDPIATWPQVSTHFVPIGAAVPFGQTWWAGFWGNWPGVDSGWYIAGDETGGSGCPMVNVAPGSGSPPGWQPVDIFIPQAKALGIDASVCSVGQLHNQGLDYLATHYDPAHVGTRMPGDEFTTIMNHVVEFLASQGLEGGITADTAYAMLLDLGCLYEDAGETYVSFPVLSDEVMGHFATLLHQQGLISQELADALSAVGTLMAQGAGIGEVIAAFDALELQPWSPADQRTLHAFADVLRNSADYWSARWSWQTFWTAVADCIGAGLGWAASDGDPAHAGIGAVVFGSAFSLAVDALYSIAPLNPSEDGFGNSHAAFDRCAIDKWQGALGVWNIDGDDHVGVTIDLDVPSVSCELQFTPLDALLGSDPPASAGTSMVVEGIIGGLPNHVIGQISVEWTSVGYEYHLDAGPLGTQIQNVALLEGGVIVAQYEGLDNPVVQTGMMLPGWEWSCFCWEYPSAPICLELASGQRESQYMVVAGNPPVLADAIVFSPVAPGLVVDSFSRMTVSTQHIPLFEILSETSEPATAVGGPNQGPPAAARLVGAYPNPFNPQIQIKLAMSIPQEVELTVHDLGGREVRRLASRLLPAGEHTFEWDGRDNSGQAASSGAYLVRLRAGNDTQATKIILLR